MYIYKIRNIINNKVYERCWNYDNMTITSTLCSVGGVLLPQ